MKLPATIAKNLKLLFRSKETAYTIIVGPLLIILLVSFAFMGAHDDYTLRVGTYAPARTAFSDATISSLNEANYLVSVYPNQDDCIDSVKTGSTDACMVFSEREAGNGTIPVTFYLDMSRSNIIYQISDDLKGSLDVQADAIRSQLTNDALSRMNTAAILVERDMNKTENLANRFAQINSNLTAAQAALSNLSNTTVNVSLDGLRGYQLGLAQNTRIVADEGTQSIDDALALISRLDRECSDCSQEIKDQVKKTSDDLENAQNKITLISQDSTKQQLFDANLLLTYAIEDLQALNKSLTTDAAARQALQRSITAASRNAQTNEQQIAQVVMSMRYTKDFLQGNTLSADDISKPVASSIVSVTVTDDRLSFTYPYLLILVIMFIGMLLASMLVVADKTSRAKFRTFTTPTSGSYHIVVGFITAFIILMVQVAVILLISSLFIAQPLLLNPITTLAIIIIAIVLFTFIGMIIGYLSSTQEAAMIASISIGSILLFVSNLIIPVEGMAGFVQLLTKFNPYLVLSELLKRSMLYGVSVAQISRELIALAALAAVLLFITIMIQRSMRRRYFRQDGGLLMPHIAAPLVLGERTVANEVELLDALDHMTRSEFEHLVKADENIIALWVRNELRNRSLSKQLRTTSKEKMMLALDKHLKTHAKHMKR